MQTPFPFLPEADRAYIENKYHKTAEPFDGFNRMQYHGYEYDPQTGDTDAEISQGLAQIAQAQGMLPRPVIKAKMVAYILEHTRIDVNEKDYFIGLYSWGRLADPYTVLPWYQEANQKATEALGNNKKPELSAAGAAWLPLDFDHTVPDWESMTKLGFPGLLQRLEDSYEKHRSAGQLTESQETFYQAAKIEYEAILAFLDRLYRYALTKNFEKAPVIAASLRNLLTGKPQNTFDVLQMIYIYFMISESLEHYQVRSLGYGLDGTLYPFYQRDLEQGTFTKEELTGFLAYFLMQFYAMGNYWGQPLYLAGTNADGTTKVNALSHLILEVFDALGINNPKIQIKVSNSTPQDFLDKALAMVRCGANNMVFCSEETMVKAMMRTGATYEQALDAVIKGCYEYALKRESIGISFSTFNALKPVSLVFHRGKDLTTGKMIGVDTGDVADFQSFEDFYNAYRIQFATVIRDGMAWIDQLEPQIYDVNPTTLYSVTIPKCVENLTSANDGGIRNISNVLLNGLGSAVDALMAVYELVFETHTVTLSQLKTALERNWEGYEVLRQKALSCKHKYGIADPIADHYANAVHQFFAANFAGKTNFRGGNYEYELHSALAFIRMGKQTEATPDGRKAGEETSKNASPTPGMDKKGVTAMIRSATSMDLSLSDSGACLDCMLHPSAVQGSEGIHILRSVLQTYLSLGGASIHFNIFSSEMLREAQKYPEKYRNLQVRVCGWNVLWNNLSKEEQEAYIKRAENIAQ